MPLSGRYTANCQEINVFCYSPGHGGTRLIHDFNGLGSLEARRDLRAEPEVGAPLRGPCFGHARSRRYWSWRAR